MEREHGRGEREASVLGRQREREGERGIWAWGGPGGGQGGDDPRFRDLS